ncbi:MAG: sigma-70 family RNA polymerase sigma factor [Bacteroidetes bacterium]|nr:sigma-70 family RNA polymerase sigma factor [Bacteroidota bacterium]
MRLLIKSDADAFTEIYNRYWDKLFAIAYNRINEIELAKDIVHDAFASLWANRANAEIIEIENYLATSVKYISLSKIKNKERERLYKAIQQPYLADSEIENTLHYKRILELVKSEVEQLPEKCRLIFKYSRNDGLPVKQIALKMNIAPKTVENQLNKALKQLKMAAKSFLGSTFIFLCSLVLF